MPKRVRWQTQIGFYLVAIGSACGLGNLWRFPYIVGENGGGAFVLLYVLLTFVIGLSLLIGELILGKTSKSSILLATSQMAKQTGKPFQWVGRLAVLMSFIVLSYYGVISGWVLHFVIRFAKEIFVSSATPFQGQMDFLMNNGLLQVALASVHLLLALLIVLKGVQDGLEKWVAQIIPIFIFLLIMLIFKSLSLPTAESALRFIFYPDFSQLTGSSLAAALGHVFFTLSVGFGTMATYGSYLSDSEHIPRAGVRIAFADSFISILAILLIYPIVLNASNIKLSDPTLLFEALPRFLAEMPGGLWFGLAFFVCLYFAALGASIGLFEVVVSNFQDKLKWSRSTSAWATGFFALIVATVPSFSGSYFAKIRVFGKGMIEFFDMVLINGILPLIALGLALVVGWGLTKAKKQEEFINDQHPVSTALFWHWETVIRFIVPGVILLALGLQIVSLLSS